MLNTPLPMTFRINGSGKFADELRNKLESNFMSHFAEGPVTVRGSFCVPLGLRRELCRQPACERRHASVLTAPHRPPAPALPAPQIDGEAVDPPRALPWYPSNLAWQCNFSRMQLRKLPILEGLHEFIKRENEAGSITRQEAVSMVPPLFLDVQPHHRVLDMCAAPGSKTAQLLEMLHASGAEPGGVVIANDADAQRCNLLTHQTKRMCSPALLITNHEAQLFPALPNLDAASPEATYLFDRILCDVPCSGDGTIRKAPDIWGRWTPANGNGLHSLQLRITLRWAARLSCWARCMLHAAA